jgi:hypothetical protein
LIRLGSITFLNREEEEKKREGERNQGKDVREKKGEKREEKKKKRKERKEIGLVIRRICGNLLLAIQVMTRGMIGFSLFKAPSLYKLQ